jgi:hypothetical protein
MRIAAKKLRYTMELYKKTFDKRLDETIKVIRDVQTLLGDIHDCDVWCEFIQTFTHEERQRTVEYYGHARSFHRLRPGFEYLKNERVTLRREKFNELAVLWKALQNSRFWEELTTYLKAPQTGSCSQALNDAITRTERPASAITNASESHKSEKSSLVGTSSSQAEPPEILNEREERPSRPAPEPGKEQSQTGPCTEEIDGKTSPADAELIRVFELPPQDEPPLQADNPSEPDHPAVSNAPLVENAICECCSQNSFPQDELRRIDSGQLLCPGCLGEFHEKVGRSAGQ